ncbi:MAG: putative zinc-binding metallopeptidase [Gammaproteobacteria bacterium]
MKAFYCSCGWRVFFENTECLGCGRKLGFDPQRVAMVSLEFIEGRNFLDANNKPRGYKLCRNYHVHKVCNWLLPAQDPSQYCLACRLNQEIPSLEEPRYQLWWANMEAAKRRLLYTLLQLKLPVISKVENADTGLAFAFLDDKRYNPNAELEFVSTGHLNGLITVNMMEADPAARENARMEMLEEYRTLLGHFRHESGHYYWRQVVQDTQRIDAFRALFGDERTDYAQSLKKYYDAKDKTGWQGEYISAYSRSHPWEDWAETWGHYLHIVDGMETAQVFGLTSLNLNGDDFQNFLAEWSGLTIMLNEMNRSVGQFDAYPFVLSKKICAKLNFVHESIAAFQRSATSNSRDRNTATPA